MKPIKQTTYETCLACCLLMLTGKSGKDQIEIWKHGWEFNYLIGQLNFFGNKYNKKITTYIENKYYFNKLKKQSGKNINIVNSKINLKLIDELLKTGQVIVYLDCYYLYHIVHAPHFVVAAKRIKDKMEIIDSNDSKIKMIPIRDLNKGIISLRNHLKYSPVLIKMD